MCVYSFDSDIQTDIFLTSEATQAVRRRLMDDRIMERERVRKVEGE